MHDFRPYWSRAWDSPGCSRLRQSLGRARGILALIVAIGVLRCDHDLRCPPDPVVVPALGAIHVTTQTTGTDPDPDGFQVKVDQNSVSMDPNDFERFQNLPFGPHTVTLSGHADNCSVANNPRTI